MLLMPFGKYEGEAVEDVPYQYLRWLIDQEFFQDDYEEECELVAAEMQYRDRFGRK